MVSDTFRVRYYCELRAIGRLLDEEQVRRLRKHSGARPVITADRFVWDGRRARDPGLDEAALMAHGFDVSLYFDGSGPRRLMFRLPARLADAVQPYLIGDRYHGVTAEVTGGDLIVRMARLEADGELSYWKDTPELWLDPILPVRAGLLSGDPAALYLGWRMAAKDHTGRPPSPVSPEPPEPPGLDRLPAPLEALDQFLRPWQGYGSGTSRPARGR
jgi:hypothetical protein